MNITSAQYLVDNANINTNVKAIIDGQEMFVPLDEENIHYAAILKWVAEGNTIKAAE
ncbi:MAG: hypothetical protein CM15mV32_0110 [Caudoviricetes sp.]|nr:MAG: hypothetical protein CM15mV32_0110 [Caudoviricetes sp.]